MRRVSPNALRRLALSRSTASFARYGYAKNTRISVLAPAPTLQSQIRYSSNVCTPSSRKYAGDSTLSASRNLAPAPTDLLELYRGLVAEGKLTWDDEQVRCIMQLRHLLNTLETYSPPMDLLARLTPSAPYLFKQAKNQATSTSWWKGKARALIGSEDLRSGSEDEDERRLVRVLSGEEELENLTTPKGILLTGPPGTGKSLLLSLFFRLLPMPKKRVHYHAFTLSLYRQVFEEMQKRRLAIPEEIERGKKVENMELAGKKGWRAVFANGRWDEEGNEVKWVREEGIPFIIARNMILEYHVLYFDELQLLDASSAALLRDVLSWYWRLGGVIVACSNRVPDDLYHHGVQKDRMIGFLDALKARCEVVGVDGGIDWRRMAEDSKEVKWFGDKKEFESAWTNVTEGKRVEPVPISVYGRTVMLPQACGRICRTTFSDLCEQPLGPADYLTLASTFSTFFIEDLPTLFLKHKNEARRLINLIDALYESRCQIYIHSYSSPTTLFFPDAVTLAPETKDEMTNERIMAAEALSETLLEPYRPNVSLYNTQTPVQKARRTAAEGKEGGSAFNVLGIWTGEDERFAYKRAVSRLVEMTSSPSYSKEEWLPLDSSSRTWEKSISTSSAGTTSVSSSSRGGSKWSSRDIGDGGQVILDDMAVEAGYSRPHRLTNTDTATKAQELKDAQAEELLAKIKPKVSRNIQKDVEAKLYNPPVIKEQHVWGVGEDWGPKAGRWGKGAKAFNTKKDKSNDDDDGDDSNNKA